ncbi:MAG: hypothetical protein KC912_05215 [Proteobacteria bacterium]|nr:hypothetical protein [Pseudomonadota bacterium]
MNTVYAALAAAAAAFALGAAIYSPVAGILPALFAFLAVGVGLFVTRRRKVDAALLPLATLLEGQRVDEAVALIEKVKTEHGAWVLGLDGQLDAQLGFMQYLQRKWDKALPLLMAGRWRNPVALLGIGAIHFRKKRFEQAWTFMKEAEEAANNDPNIFIVHAVLRMRKGEREQALQALGRGAEACENSKPIERLRRVIANGKRIDPDKLPEFWMQIWPEDMIAKMRRQGLQPGGPGMPAPRGGGNRASRRKR